jgi:hypothetical protein
MNDDEIVTALRSAKGTLTPVELAQLAGKLAGSDLTQGRMITIFNRAFPNIPLRVLLDAGAWSQVSDGGLDDEAFNDLLRPWL